MALVNDVFHTHLDSFVIIYLDDILVYSNTIEEHLLNLRKILELLRQHKLYAKMSKCAFFLPAVEYLGHLLSDVGISVEQKPKWIPSDSDCYRIVKQMFGPS